MKKLGGRATMYRSWHMVKPGAGRPTQWEHNIPGKKSRAVDDIFNIMETMNDHTFKVTVSFMELYQEQVYDLLSEKDRNERIVDIRKDKKAVKVVDITKEEVTDAKTW